MKKTWAGSSAESGALKIKKISRSTSTSISSLILYYYATNFLKANQGLFLFPDIFLLQTYSRKKFRKFKRFLRSNHSLGLMCSTLTLDVQNFATLSNFIDLFDIFKPLLLHLQQYFTNKYSHKV